MSPGPAMDCLICSKYHLALVVCFVLFIANQYDQILLICCKCHLAQMLQNVVFVLAFPLPALHAG